MDAHLRSKRDLSHLLRAAGQRVTAQRLAVLSAFSLPGEHLTAEEIVERVQRASPIVDRSTVYRTLERFRDLRLITETDLGEGVRQYELLDEERHHHLICHKCRCMIEFDDELLDEVRDQIFARYGFTAGIEHLALFGLCAHCAAEPHDAPAPE
jgi:Fur family ferric uptake transcriptional regulator